MATLTEMVAAVVVQSSVAAFSHFGVTLETPHLEQKPTAAAERVVARSPKPPQRVESVQKASDCPDAQRARAVKV